MFVSISNLILLIFFHMLFSEFSDILRSKDDFFFSESVDSIFCRVFVEFYLIKAHSRFKLIISKKRKHVSCCRNRSIRDILDHRQLIRSIVLLMIDVSSQISLHFLIENFTLLIRFWVKCDEQFRFYFQHSTNRISYQRYELRIFIWNHRSR